MSQKKIFFKSNFIHYVWKFKKYKNQSKFSYTIP